MAPGTGCYFFGMLVHQAAGASFRRNGRFFTRLEGRPGKVKAESRLGLRRSWDQGEHTFNFSHLFWSFSLTDRPVCSLVHTVYRKKKKTAPGSQFQGLSFQPLGETDLFLSPRFPEKKILTGPPGSVPTPPLWAETEVIFRSEARAHTSVGQCKVVLLSWADIPKRNYPQSP